MSNVGVIGGGGGGGAPDVSTATGILPLANAGEGISQAINTISTTGTINALVPTTGITILSGAAPNINGITAPSPAQARKITLVFTGSTSLTINAQSGSATAVDRIITPANTAIRFYPNNSVTLIYDDSATRWRFFSNNGALYNTNTVTGAGILTIANTGGVQLITPATCDASGNINTNGVITSNSSMRSPYYNTQAGTTFIDTSNFLAFDASGFPSCGFDGRNLWDTSGGVISIAWGNRYLGNSDSTISLNWDSRGLINAGGLSVLTWEDQYLVSTDTSYALNWTSRQLFNGANSLVADWNSGDLYNPGTGLTSINWNSFLLYDSVGTPSASYDLRTLYFATGNASIDWNLAALYDGNNIVSISYAAGARVLVNSSSANTLNWEAQTLIDGGVTVLDWSDSVGVKFTQATATTVPYLDASKRLISSAVTPTQLGYVAGVTSAIQTQLNAKVSTTLNSANILVGNGSNVATAVAMSGDISTTNAGVTAYAGNLPVSKLNSGTGATSSTFWRGDGTWATPTATFTFNTDLVPTTDAARSIGANGGNHLLNIFMSGAIYGITNGTYIDLSTAGSVNLRGDFVVDGTYIQCYDPVYMRAGAILIRAASAGSPTMTSTSGVVGITSTASPRTVTLPAASACVPGQIFIVQDESGGALTNNITIAAAGADTINGAASVAINLNYGGKLIYTDGSSKFFVVA